MLYLPLDFEGADSKCSKVHASLAAVSTLGFECADSQPLIKRKFPGLYLPLKLKVLAAYQSGEIHFISCIYP